MVWSLPAFLTLTLSLTGEGHERCRLPYGNEEERLDAIGRAVAEYDQP